jgi:hypothetical protein
MLVGGSPTAAIGFEPHTFEPHTLSVNAFHEKAGWSEVDFALGFQLDAEFGLLHLVRSGVFAICPISVRGTHNEALTTASTILAENIGLPSPLLIDQL